MTSATRAPAPAGAVPDWEAATGEATALLSRYLQFNTLNPPAHSGEAARWLAGLLAAAGVDVALDGPRPEKLSVIARLPGGSAAPPLMLYSHIDVVPVAGQPWSVDPFGGVIKDGAIWGRGALDIKGLGMIQLLTVLNLRRHGVALGRDVLFVACPDEESFGPDGLAWIADRRPEVRAATEVLDEGGSILPLAGHQIAMFTAAEKGSFDMRLTALGTAGHSSRPHGDNAFGRLARAITRVDGYMAPVRLRPATRAFLATLAALSGVSPAAGTALARLIESPAGPAAFALLRQPALQALFRSTAVVTMAQVGSAPNVIPARADATLNARLLPGTDVRAFVGALLRRIGDPRVQIRVLRGTAGSESPLDTPLARAITAGVRAAAPAIVTTPSLLPGMTDGGRLLRRRGKTVYGFAPYPLTLDLVSTIHSHDERLPIASLRTALEIYWAVVTRAAGA